MSDHRTRKSISHYVKYVQLWAIVLFHRMKRIFSLTHVGFYQRPYQFCATLFNNQMCLFSNVNLSDGCMYEYPCISR